MRRTIESIVSELKAGDSGALLKHEIEILIAGMMLAEELSKPPKQQCDLVLKLLVYNTLIGEPVCL